MAPTDTHRIDSELPLKVINSELATLDIEVVGTDLLLALTGAGSERLALIGRELGISVGLRGHTIRLQGPEVDVALAQRVFDELMDVIKRGADLADLDVLYSIRTLRSHPEVKLRDLFEHVVVTASRGRQITPKGMAQKRYIQAIRDYDVVFGVGPAGTGKTYLAMGMAVAAFQERRVSRIILTRPAVEAGEKLGFLPGDLAEKVNPYLRPLYDALHDMMPVEKVYSLIERGTIEVAPLAFMRGRTLNDCFVILDEAQNTTIAQMKMFLTRLGVCSKAVIAGDVTQVDLDKSVRSGLLDAVELLKDVDGIRCCYFSEADVVRHPIVQRIVEAYDWRDARRDKEADNNHEKR
ncbi:MAG: PhoH family protein [Deltaproteobacteria bacterium]|nr:PhoH family protein [Deltaproteobacteria bacterium]